MDITDIKPEMQLTWQHTMRSGYGYTINVPVVVRSIGPKRVRVEAPLLRGGTKLVSVAPDKLSKKIGA